MTHYADTPIINNLENASQHLRGFRPVTNDEALTISGGAQSGGSFALTFHMPDTGAEPDLS